MPASSCLTHSLLHQIGVPPLREGPHLSINVCPSSCSTISSGKCEDLRWRRGQSQNPRDFPKCHTHLAPSGSKSTNYQLQRLREHSALKMYPQSPESSSQERPDVLRLSSVHPEPEGPAPRRRVEIHAVQSETKHLSWRGIFTCSH